AGVHSCPSGEHGPAGCVPVDHARVLEPGAGCDGALQARAVENEDGLKPVYVCRLRCSPVTDTPSHGRTLNPPPLRLTIRNNNLADTFRFWTFCKFQHGY